MQIVDEILSVSKISLEMNFSDKKICCRFIDKFINKITDREIYRQ